MPASQIIQEAKEQNSQKHILVQGMIDLYYINEKDEILLVDFKTDYIKNAPNAKQAILEKYKEQLQTYKQALEQALGRKVTKASLCLANNNWELIEI